MGLRACEVLELSERTLQRWRAQGTGCDRRKGPDTLPAHTLDEAERAELIRVATSPEFRELAPAQIVARLADQGVYLASESSFYRVLKEHKMSAPRGPTKPREPRARPELVAHAPNQVWTWDITYLGTNVRGKFDYLYLALDLFSRKLVGWCVQEHEAMEHSSQLLARAAAREKIQPGQLTLRSDNGSPMKGSTMLATMQRLGVACSFSRPSVSHDNAYSESALRTMKYRAWHPRDGFESREQARERVGGFVRWYNEEHRHSGIGYVTPSQRHSGRDVELLVERRQVYQQARDANPGRDRPPSTAGTQA